MSERALRLLSNLPRPNERRIALRVTPGAERMLRDGHPWLFDGSITKQSHEGEPGDLGVVFDRKGRFLAIGLYDPASPLRVRILHAGEPRAIDSLFWQQRIESALARRAPLAARATGTTHPTDGYRLIHGENDGLPGLVADRYGETLVVKLYTLAWLPHLNDVLTALLAQQPATRLVLRLNRAMQRRLAQLYGLADGQILFGPPLEGPVLFQENGICFEADPVRGQKTGFFLDQRENRERVERLAQGRDVLNVFAYNGGFSLYAARGGARSVTSLDISAPALAACERNFTLNPRLANIRHRTVAEDAFSALASMAQDGVQFDLVILDPPAFAKRQAEVEGALAAYQRLTQLGLGVLKPGGILVSASCSSRVSADQFFAAVSAGARRIGRPLLELERSGQPLDHPATFPEGAYLKCLFAQG
ncbi:MAG: class I SAM-dependent methyltransferase [Caldilineaceae bacterium]|nr:class I SAM-dependent methyltransferase [Caldilineaceae bacterium]